MLELAELVLTHGVSLRATADLVKILDHEVSALTYSRVTARDLCVHIVLSNEDEVIAA